MIAPLVFTIIVSLALLGLLAYQVRRSRHQARKRTLEAIAASYGIDTMVKIGQDLGWIEAVETTPTGVRVKIRR